jgi:hypothetical protein
MYVCMYVRTYVCKYILYVCTRMCICVFMYVGIQACVYVLYTYFVHVHIRSSVPLVHSSVG